MEVITTVTQIHYQVLVILGIIVTCIVVIYNVKKNNKFIFLKKINMKNIDKGIDAFNKGVQNFGDSMDTMNKEISSDIEKSNKETKSREKKNKENIEKIWGKKNEM